MTRKTEFTFDVELKAVVRVTAKSETAARNSIADILDTVEPGPEFLSGYNGEMRGEGLRITEFSLGSSDPVLFERNGEEVEGPQPLTGAPTRRQLYDGLSDALQAFEGEEDSVKEEHADLIKQLQALAPSLHEESRT